MVMISENLGRKMAQNFANFALLEKKGLYNVIIDHLPYGMIVE